MIRSAAGKVAWMARATTTVVGLAIMLALVFGFATTALSATGGNFLLGKANGADRVSKLTASIAGPALTLVNQSTETAATALNLNVAEDKPPLKVNAAAGTAKNLSADELDGKDSAAYQRRVSGECPAGESIRAIGADGASVTCEPDDQGDGGTAQVDQLRSDLATNDGTPNEASDPVSFSKVKDVPADVLGRNAATLDGKTASQFANAAHQHSGADITSGTLAEARIDGTVTRDDEVTTIVKANDGPGSGLDADTLDNQDSSTFAGSGKSNYGLGTTLNGCTEQALLTRTISPSRPALVYASGASVYNQNGSGLPSGTLKLELLDSANNVVASGAYMRASGSNTDVPLSAQGVLMSGSNVWNSSIPFEVTPGNTYSLRLVGGATNGSCTGTPKHDLPTMSYLLIGK